MEIDITNRVEKMLRLAFPILLAAALLCAGAVWLYQQGQRSITLYDARVNGRLVQVRAKTEGTVAELCVKDNDLVKAGQSLAKIQVRVTEEQLQQLQRNVTMAEQQLNRLKEGTAVSKPVYKNSGAQASPAAAERLARMEELYRLGAVSAAERDEAAAAARSQSGAGSVTYETVIQSSSPEAIKNAELRLEQAAAALQNARSKMAETEIKAPVDGSVYLQELAKGQEIKPGQTLAHIGNGESLWVETEIGADRLEKVHAGQYALCIINGKRLQGVVTGTGPREDSADRFMVYVSLQDINGLTIRPGDKAEVELSLP